MRIRTSLPFTILIWLMLAQAALAVQFFHDPPPPALLGEPVHLELTYSENRQPVSNVFVFYRTEGEHNFFSLRMHQEGLVLTVDVPTTKMVPGNLEYYFAYQDAYGAVKYLPEQNPEQNPFRMRILPAKQQETATEKNIFTPLLLSPTPGEVIPSDNLLIAYSLPLEIEHPEQLSYKLFIDGVDVTRLLKAEENLLSFQPNSIRGGIHNAELKVFDTNGRLIGKNQFSFRISRAPSSQKAFSSNTRLFLDNRYQNLHNASENYFRGGLDWGGSYKRLDFRARALVSSEETADRQPINQFGIRLVYNFNPRNNIYLKGGDFTTNYDPLSFWEKRVRGIGAGFNTSYFNFDYSYGQSLRSVEGIADSSGKITRYGTYTQNFMSFRPQFNFGRHFSWAFDLINSKDDQTSIRYGLNPKEALVVGSSFRLNLDNKRILFKGSFQASMKNEDARGSIDFDSLATQYGLSESEKEQARSYVDLLEKTGFLTLSQGLSPLPSFGMQFEGRLNYFGHSLRAIYKKVDGEFASPGNLYLQKDVAGYFINDNIRMLNNQVLLNLYFNAYDENLDNNDLRTGNTAIGGSISYFPFQNLPSISLTYGTIRRENELGQQGINPDSTIYRVEDNRLERYGFSSSYNLNTGSIRNTLSFSASKFHRTDAVYDMNQSDFTVFSLGLRSRFAFPLTTRFNYTQSGSDFGAGASRQESKIKKIQLGIDYLVKHILGKSDLKPFFRLSFQNISNSYSTVSEYKRQNYSGGFYLRNAKFGTLSLRYDYIDYGTLYNWKDTILSTRYEVAF